MNYIEAAKKFAFLNALDFREHFDNIEKRPHVGGIFFRWPSPSYACPKDCDECDESAVYLPEEKAPVRDHLYFIGRITELLGGQAASIHRVEAYSDSGRYKWNVVIDNDCDRVVTGVSECLAHAALESAVGFIISERMLGHREGNYEESQP